MREQTDQQPDAFADLADARILADLRRLPTPAEAELDEGVGPVDVLVDVEVFGVLEFL